ncbi:replication-relaxation family protein [Bacillus mycoides]|uniref:replication-relaxation family protein n=1 Tax=Bacillus mycoides TaxID=1405 RepID=UPI00027C1794|nr:replication-relaxation family protein [Bacillus mycoides]EJV59333.1 hypothetical protein IEU_05598 [Bacillus mycoides]
MRRLGFLTRKQLQRIHQLGKTRNTNIALKSLDEYVIHYREGYDTVYYLSKLGREYVQSKRQLRKNQFVGHILMRNEWFIYSGMPEYWKNEVKIGDNTDTRICDTLYKENGYLKILEVDRLQKMSENKIKAQSYYGMYKRGTATRQLGYFPVVVWLTSTELRRKQIKGICNDLGLPSEVYTLEDIQ